MTSRSSSSGAARRSPANRSRTRRPPASSSAKAVASTLASTTINWRRDRRAPPARLPSRRRGHPFDARCVRGPRRAWEYAPHPPVGQGGTPAEIDRTRRPVAVARSGHPPERLSPGCSACCQCSAIVALTHAYRHPDNYNVVIRVDLRCHYVNTPSVKGAPIFYRAEQRFYGTVMVAEPRSSVHQVDRFQGVRSGSLGGNPPAVPVVTVAPLGK